MSSSLFIYLFIFYVTLSISFRDIVYLLSNISLLHNPHRSCTFYIINIHTNIFRYDCMSHFIFFNFAHYSSVFPEGLHLKRTSAKINATRVCVCVSGRLVSDATTWHEQRSGQDCIIVCLLAGELSIFISVSILSSHAEMRVLFLAPNSPKTGNCTTAERIR